ncbi:hypothetical protein EPN95_02760 [Patescibacteria group bacterium]|nr:MAG: hypothetical protein EPN95_02760 [Patescibacteria group bacterium]
MGVFVAIEGGDGSGKATQSALLAEFAQNELHKDVLKVSFPQYGQPSAYYAGKYLDGAYGDVNAVPADLASLTYAIDRFAAKDAITSQLAKDNGIVIADRYVASNLAHQGTKFDNEAERHAYYDRMVQTEYGTLGIPRPDINIVLILPTDLAQANVDKKDTRPYTNKKRDIHEADPNHLEKAKANYEELCRLYPNEFTAIQCVDESGIMRPIEIIQQEIRNKLNF